MFLTRLSSLLLTVFLSLTEGKVLITDDLSVNATILGEFEAPRYSRIMGNIDSWNCEQELEIISLNEGRFLCNSELQSIQNTFDDLNFSAANKALALIDMEHNANCFEEEIYKNTERLGFSMLLGVSDELEGQKLNVHNFRQPVREGSIPFLEVGSDFMRTFEDELRKPNGNLSTELFLVLESCEDRSKFERPINEVQRNFFIFESLISFLIAFIAFDGFRKLSSEPMAFPRKVMLAIDGTVILFIGLMEFSGMSKNYCHAWLLGDDNISQQMKSILTNHLGYVQYFTTILATLYWDLLRKLCFRQLRISSINKWFYFQHNKKTLIVAFFLCIVVGEIVFSTLEFFPQVPEVVSLLKYFLLTFALMGISIYFWVQTKQFLKEAENISKSRHQTIELKEDSSESIYKKLFSLTQHISFWLKVFSASVLFSIIGLFTLFAAKFALDLSDNNPHYDVVFYMIITLTVKVQLISKVMAIRGPQKTLLSSSMKRTEQTVIHNTSPPASIDHSTRLSIGTLTRTQPSTLGTTLEL